MSLFILLMISLIILLLFGNRLSSAIREFRRGLAGLEKTISSNGGRSDDPPTASGVFARLKPGPSSGTAAQEPDPDEEK
jgi:Sec-independent protein translocase protein TatA